VARRRGGPSPRAPRGRGAGGGAGGDTQVRPPGGAVWGEGPPRARAVGDWRTGAVSGDGCAAARRRRRNHRRRTRRARSSLSGGATVPPFEPPFWGLACRQDESPEHAALARARDRVTKLEAEMEALRVGAAWGRCMLLCYTMHARAQVSGLREPLGGTEAVASRPPSGEAARARHAGPAGRWQAGGGGPGCGGGARSGAPEHW
jgi:hypothetical protein